MNTGNLYLTYELGGLHPAKVNEVGNDFLGYTDDLAICLYKRQYDDEPYLVAKVELSRVPSDLRNRIPGEYRMVSAMELEKMSNGHLIAPDFADKEFMDKFNLSTSLKDNDVYIIRRFYVNDRYQRQGYGTFVLENLKAWIHRMTGDVQPIIVTIVDHRNAEDPDYAVKFLQKRNFAFLSEKTPALYF